MGVGVEVEKLSDTARQYIGKDVVSGFLEYTETNSNRARAECGIHGHGAYRRWLVPN